MVILLYLQYKTHIFLISFCLPILRSHLKSKHFVQKDKFTIEWQVSLSWCVFCGFFQLRSGFPWFPYFSSQGRVQSALQGDKFLKTTSPLKETSHYQVGFSCEKNMQLP